jgi:hypothetical protein
MAVGAGRDAFSSDAQPPSNCLLFQLAVLAGVAGREVGDAPDGVLVKGPKIVRQPPTLPVEARMVAPVVSTLQKGTAPFHEQSPRRQHDK